MSVDDGLTMLAEAVCGGQLSSYTSSALFMIWSGLKMRLHLSLLRTVACTAYKR